MPKPDPAQPALKLPKFEMRKTWKNVAKNQKITPLRYFQPTTLNDLKAIVAAAEADDLRVRAVGSGHSFSRVALTDGYMIDPCKMDRVLDLNMEQLMPEAQNRHLIHVEGGISLAALSKFLDKKLGLSISSLGTIDVQTLAGAMATGTHGTGWTKPSIPDMVHQITLVTHGGKVLQIEPTNGITNAAVFNRPGVELMQRDDLFYSAVLSMGAMGVVYSVVLEAEPLFWLNEVKSPTNTWSKVDEYVLSGDIFQVARHVSLRINPYSLQNKNGNKEHSVQIIKMFEVPPFERFYQNLNQRFRNIKAQIAGKIPGLADIMVQFQNLFPHTIPGAVESSLTSTKDKSYKNKSYKVFNQGQRQISKRGLSCEWAFALDSGNHVRAIEQAFKIVQKSIEFGHLYQNAPISMRVAPPSKHYLSTSFGKRMIYVEFPMIIGTKGAEEMLNRFQEQMIKLEGRPHWGKFHNRLLEADKLIPPLYPKWKEWCKVFLELNPKGTFDNQFTDRMGFRTKRGF